MKTSWRRFRNQSSVTGVDCNRISRRGGSSQNNFDGGVRLHLHTSLVILLPIRRECLATATAHHLIWYYKPVQSLSCGQSLRVFSAVSIWREAFFISTPRRVHQISSSMKKFGHWITNFFAITAAISVAGVQGAASEFVNKSKDMKCANDRILWAFQKLWFSF